MPETDGWRFHNIGLIVTGKGERDFLPELFRTLAAEGHCAFSVVAQIGQRSPSGPKKIAKMVGAGKTIPDRDAEEIGVAARKWFNEKRESSLVVLVDDLEHERRAQKQAVFDRYRAALDTMLLSDELRSRASVHFLVNMLEAYYFADAKAVNDVLGTSLADHVGDVEEIRHPKNDLKKLHPGFDEVADGKEIAKKLDVLHVLDNPETCASLRTIFAWCAQKSGTEIGERFRLDGGKRDEITSVQISN